MFQCRIQRFENRWSWKDSIVPHVSYLTPANLKECAEKPQKATRYKKALNQSKMNPADVMAKHPYMTSFHYKINNKKTKYKVFWMLIFNFFIPETSVYLQPKLMFFGFFCYCFVCSYNRLCVIYFVYFWSQSVTDNF